MTLAPMYLPSKPKIRMLPCLKSLLYAPPELCPPPFIIIILNFGLIIFFVSPSLLIFLNNALFTFSCF